MSDKRDPKRFTWDELGRLAGPPPYMPIQTVAAILGWSEEEVLDACEDGRLEADNVEGEYLVATISLAKREHRFSISAHMLRDGAIVPRPRFSYDKVRSLGHGPITPEDIANLTGQTVAEVHADIVAGRLYAFDESKPIHVLELQFLDDAGLLLFSLPSMLPGRFEKPRP